MPTSTPAPSSISVAQLRSTVEQLYTEIDGASERLPRSVRRQSYVDLRDCAYALVYTASEMEREGPTVTQRLRFAYSAGRVQARASELGRGGGQLSLDARCWSIRARELLDLIQLEVRP